MGTESPYHLFVRASVSTELVVETPATVTKPPSALLLRSNLQRAGRTCCEHGISALRSALRIASTTRNATSPVPPAWPSLSESVSVSLSLSLRGWTLSVREGWAGRLSPATSR